METLLIMYIIFGAFLAIISLPLIAQKIKPNPLYGFRVSQTLDDPKVWYAVNQHFGKRSLVAGLSITIAAILFYFVPGLGIDTYVWLCFGVFALVFIVGLVQSWRYMKGLDK